MIRLAGAYLKKCRKVIAVYIGIVTIFFVVFFLSSVPVDTVQYAAFLLPTCKDQWTGIHEQSGARITCKKFCENRQWILLDTVYYHDCGSNLHPGIFNCNSSKLL